MTDRSQYRFSTPLRVRWAEVDPQRIVFNPNYLLYNDIAYTEYMRDTGVEMPGGFAQFGIDSVMARSEIDYRASAQYDDELTLCARTAKIGTKSITVLVAIFRGEELLTEIKSIYVAVKTGTTESCAVPQAVKDFLAEYETAPIEGV